MTRQTAVHMQHTPTIPPLSKGGILQRKCDTCGQRKMTVGDCEYKM
ncbi:hypothetical protein [Scytonema hofmannii]|nr:hypothetical protein [Scytonema hofmannii]